MAQKFINFMKNLTYLAFGENGVNFIQLQNITQKENISCLNYSSSPAVAKFHHICCKCTKQDIYCCKAPETVPVNLNIGSTHLICCTSLTISYLNNSK